MDLQPGRPLRKHEITALLSEARSRTLALVEPLAPEDLVGRHGPGANPVVRELDNIARFEEFWLMENLEATDPGSEDLRETSDGPHPVGRATALPGAEEVLDRMRAVRERVLSKLDGLDLSRDRPLLRDGFVFRMVLQHEYRHNEIILQVLQGKEDQPYRAPRGPAAHDRGAGGRDAPLPASMVKVPGGRVRVGTDDRSEAGDSERPAHSLELEPFWIDATPVTGARFLAFMAEGGYRERSLWSDEGWEWREEEEVLAPAYWFRENERWMVRRMERVREVDRSRPVCHVGYWEAEAFARWAGKRLPTEAEWEVAASRDPETGVRHRFPWGDEPATPVRANVDGPTFDTTPVGCHTANVSPVGCHGMIGDVWEWTSSDFTGYPGFDPFPSPRCSEVLFGQGYKVLRGGSWATRAAAVRATVRNRALPARRRIFSGFRCARDAG